MPLMERSQINNPNYYNRLLVAIPKPYKTTEGVGRLVSDKSVLVNEEGAAAIQALGIYSRTKGVIHEDGTFEVVKLPVLNTGDDIRIKGYHIGQREEELPNPLKDHPFLASNKPSKLINGQGLPVISVNTIVEVIPLDNLTTGEVAPGCKCAAITVFACFACGTDQSYPLFHNLTE
jgi:hypothetical protein